MSSSRPVLRAAHINTPASLSIGDPASGVTGAVQGPDAAVTQPQPFESLAFSLPPVDMSGLPPPEFASSTGSLPSLPDVVQTMSVSNTKLSVLDEDVGSPSDKCADK